MFLITDFKDGSTSTKYLYLQLYKKDWGSIPIDIDSNRLTYVSKFTPSSCPFQLLFLPFVSRLEISRYFYNPVILFLVSFCLLPLNLRCPTILILLSWSAPPSSYFFSFYFCFLRLSLYFDNCHVFSRFSSCLPFTS